MDRPSGKSKTKKSPVVKVVGLVTGLTVAAAVGVFVVLPKVKEHLRHAQDSTSPGATTEKGKKPEKGRHAALPPAVHQIPSKPVSERLSDVVHDFQHKVDRLSEALEENHRLKLENASLRVWAEALRFDCTALESERRTGQLSMRLDEETGASVGRTLASIRYRPPAHILPEQLFTLGLSYFKAQEVEKSAVIFTFLTGMEDSAEFRTAQNYLITGVAWYRLDHFKEADRYFDFVLKQPRVNKNLQYQAQARLWKALVAKRLSHHRNSQQWLKDLLDHHPHSTEARWVNGIGVSRQPAHEE